MQSAQPRRIHGPGLVVLRVLVPVPAPDSLVTTGAEGPSPVLGGGAVPGEEDTSDVGGLSGMVECGIELVDGVGAEGVTDLGPIEGDADHPVAGGPVVGDIGELEPGDLGPCRAVEYF